MDIIVYIILALVIFQFIVVSAIYVSRLYKFLKLIYRIYLMTEIIVIGLIIALILT